LREQISSLTGAGLAADEAFLVAVKRMGALDGLSREFAREHSDRLWKQLVLAPTDSGADAATQRDGIAALGFAIGAGVAVKVPVLFGMDLDTHESVYIRNLSFFVLPLLTAYFAWKRQVGTATIRALVAAFAVAAIAINVLPFTPAGTTEVLSALHLPIALWLVVGVSYASVRWKEVDGRMDFIRFSGELFIYYVLIALGGGVLTGFMASIFLSVGIRVDTFFQQWLIPCCAAGAVIVASWLVEAKKSVVENMAPVLARLFTPMFALVLIAFLVTLLVTGRPIEIKREILIMFDGLLAVVLGMLLYSMSARDANAEPTGYDALQVILVVAALAADAVALWAMATRIGELGSTPNRLAGLGMNIVLLVNLAWSAVLYIKFMRGRGEFAALERWQTSYLPVYAAWAAVVAIVFPFVFGFV